MPIYVGAATDQILRDAAFFAPTGADLKPAGHLRYGEPLELGRFTVTSIRVDHSAYDSHALLVEADGRRLFYTADLRATGHSRSFQELVDKPPHGVDVLLMEGTQVYPGEPRHSQLSEADVEAQCEGALLGHRRDGVGGLLLPERRSADLPLAGRDRERSVVLASPLWGDDREDTRPHPLPPKPWDQTRSTSPNPRRVKVKESGESRALLRCATCVSTRRTCVQRKRAGYDLQGLDGGS